MPSAPIVNRYLRVVKANYGYGWVDTFSSYDREEALSVHQQLVDEHPPKRQRIGHRRPLLPKFKVITRRIPNGD